jgi:thioesterase domain-containing protein
MPDVRDILVLWRYPDESRAALESLYRAFLNYVPTTYPGQVTLLRAQALPLWSRHDRGLGWRDLATGGVRVSTIPGSHHGNLLTEPYVRVLAAELRAYIDRACTVQSAEDSGQSRQALG